MIMLFNLHIVYSNIQNGRHVATTVRSSVQNLEIGLPVIFLTHWRSLLVPAIRQQVGI